MRRRSAPLRLRRTLQIMTRMPKRHEPLRSTPRGHRRRRIWRFALLVGLVASTIVPAAAEAAGLRPREVQQGYREVLGLLGSGKLDEALTALVEFEQGVVGDEQAWRHMDSFFRLKLRVLRDLLKSQPLELLRPVMMLHHDAYFRYVESGRRHLAHHARQMASELAELYAKRSETPEARAFGGGVLTSFGAYLWSPSSIGESADLFYRAVLVDPGNETATLGLAAAYERHGDYEKASEYLRQALRRQRENSEARLRLALCRLRSEQQPSPGVLAALQALTDAGEPSWIRSVAYQELASAELRGGQEERAQALLLRALKELPGDQQLSLQLAVTFDRQRRREDVLRVLDAVDDSDDRQDSPRFRYDVWSPQGIEQLREALHQEMKTGLVALGAGLLFAADEEAGE